MQTLNQDNSIAPYPSWVWCQIENKYKAPVDFPGYSNDASFEWMWDEENTKWVNLYF